MRLSFQKRHRCTHYDKIEEKVTNKPAQSTKTSHTSFSQMFHFTTKEKALDTLAILCKRCEQVNCDPAYVDKKFEKKFEEVEEAMKKRRRRSRDWRKLQ